MNNIKNSKTYNRLIQYRVDFAYSKNQFFEAANRIKKEEEKYHHTKRILEIASIVIDVLTLSSIAVYFSDLYGDGAIVIIALLSIISIGISIFLLLYDNKTNHLDYISTANAYLGLYKRTKNLEARVGDDLISLEELAAELDSIHNEQVRLTKKNLATEYADYQKAKESIEKGESAYTDTDIANT